MSWITVGAAWVHLTDGWRVEAVSQPGGFVLDALKNNKTTDDATVVQLRGFKSHYFRNCLSFIVIDQFFTWLQAVLNQLSPCTVSSLSGCCLCKLYVYSK